MLATRWMSQVWLFASRIVVLEFTALQLWQVRLPIYSSERRSTRAFAGGRPRSRRRATHIQCSSRSTLGKFR